jgi:murein tripeptide amidase MpaA
MIDQLVIGYDTQPLIRQFVDNLDWFIVPLLNPDGFFFLIIILINFKYKKRL